jgi:hypothetical protein
MLREPGAASAGADPSRDPLPAELEERIAALESGAECGEDFDRASLVWLLLLGVVMPVALLAAGWWLA